MKILLGEKNATINEEFEEIGDDSVRIFFHVKKMGFNFQFLLIRIRKFQKIKF